MCNGLIITPDVMYAILINIDGKQQTILLNDGEFMDKDIYGYNAIPHSDINDMEMVKAHIKGIIDKYNTNQKFHLARVQILHRKRKQRKCLNVWCNLLHHK